MKKQSIYDVITQHQRLLECRNKMHKLFNGIAPCSVTIGGSYMLKYWCEDFSEREVADYDMILYAEKAALDKIKNHVRLLVDLTKALDSIKYYDYSSFYMGKCNGKRVNIILKEGKHIGIFESLEEIIQAKRAFVAKALKKGQKPRQKDLEDIEVYENWKANELPF